MKDNRIVQIIGTRGCRVTRKAERFFKDRGYQYHFNDLAVRGPSRGELEAVRAACPGEALIDEDSQLFKKRGLAYMEFDELEELLEHPLLLRTPVVRRGKRAALGDDPEGWAALLAEG